MRRIPAVIAAKLLDQLAAGEIDHDQLEAEAEHWIGLLQEARRR